MERFFFNVSDFFDTVAAEIFSTSSNQKVRTEDGWKITETEYVGGTRTRTVVIKEKLDGTERVVSEKIVDITKEELQKLEADAVSRRDYSAAARYKAMIDRMK